jgi:hypothetical protein
MKVSLLITALSWTCVGIFAATGVITLLALIGRVQLGDPKGTRHHHYLGRLFTLLILEVVTVGVGAFGTAIQGATKQAREMQRSSAVGDSLQTIATKQLTTVLTENQTLRKRLLQLAVKPKSAVVTVAPPKQQTVSSSILYVTSAASREGSVDVAIPPGWHYLRHHVINTTKNGDGSSSVSAVTGATGDTTAIRLSLRLPSRRVFGPNNWWGAVLEVVLQERR